MQIKALAQQRVATDRTQTNNKQHYHGKILHNR